MIDRLVAQGGTAHEAEAKAIEQIRKLGNGILTGVGGEIRSGGGSQGAGRGSAVAAVPKKKP